jgi:ribosomal protein S18 acetylase RimI-like enzyme
LTGDKCNLEIAPYDPAHFDGVKALWESCFPNNSPWNQAEQAIPAKEAFQPELFFVALLDDVVIGTTIAGYDGHRGWLYYVAVDPAHRGTGVAAALIGEAEAHLLKLGCVKINLQVRASNSEVTDFYRKLGYLDEDMISMGKHIG